MSTVLILRTCKSDMTSYGGFQWPGIGEKVEAPDWDPRPICGYGLHGLLWGIGGSGYLDEDETAKGVVFEAEESEVVWIDGDKVKVPAGVVRFIGTLGEAAAWLDERKPAKEKAGVGGTATAGVGGTATAGYRGTATAGYRGTATAGDEGTATAGDEGTATAGDEGTATAGDRGTATAGYRGTATAGDEGTATAGYRGTASAGDRGTASAGDRGTATAGVGGTATAGDEGTATAGYRGTASAGDRGTASAGVGGAVVIQRWNGNRYVLSVAAIKDEDGQGQLEPNVRYRLDDAGAFVAVGEAR